MGDNWTGSFDVTRKALEESKEVTKKQMRAYELRCKQNYLRYILSLLGVPYNKVEFYDKNECVKIDNVLIDRYCAGGGVVGPYFEPYKCTVALYPANGNFMFWLGYPYVVHLDLTFENRAQSRSDFIAGFISKNSYEPPKLK